MIRVAHIDDEKDYGFLFWTLVHNYNKTATEKIKLTNFSCPNKFWDGFSDDPEDYDLVITDIAFVNENGYDLAQKIYKNSTHDILPVVLILSSHVAPDETFASLVSKTDINIKDIIDRFLELSKDAHHRNMTDVILRSEDYANGLAHI
jgi:response regulator RpfG family c-di-GMP phosphodiesterase